MKNLPKTKLLTLALAAILPASAYAGILKLTAKTERPYAELVFPPKGKNWGCGVDRPVAKTNSGKKFCPN